MEAVLSLLLDTMDTSSDAKAFVGGPLASLTLSQIDLIFSTLKAALQSFQRYIDDQTIRYRLHPNTIGSNIHKIPTELLSHILRLSVPLEHWSVRRLQGLAQVSKRWKYVVTSTPEI
ncbi:hypothetical protein FRB96_001872 [Tulasnella sp. 330]|nr:hypothetical protein FRB96_001872 [Tulasnella sp. 330]